MQLDLNAKFREALSVMEDSVQSVFITGRAGTGKSTLLQYFQGHTEKNIVVLAPTGVAAVNVAGVTIHSFFGFKPDITIEKAWDLGHKVKKPELYLELDAIVIDEISMVRADLIDCVDAFLRRITGSTKAFGGKQLIMFGDLYQLPPVVTGDEREIFRTRYSSPFFFSSDAVARLSFEYIELDQIYRQSDPNFIDILNAVRSRMVTDHHLTLLNARVNPDYAPPPEEYTVHLTGTNRDAETYNTMMLTSLPGELFSFRSDSSGNFDKKAEPAPRTLTIKSGAQIMLTHNDRGGAYINGTVGRVERIDTEKDGTPLVRVMLQSNKVVEISPHTWEMYSFAYNSRKKRIETDVIGTYTQLPMILAWSITVHKSQGKTFDRVIIDLPRSFAHGQTYVALSRATSLEGIVLKKPLSRGHVLMDYSVVHWLTSIQYGKAHAKQPIAVISKLLQEAITANTPLEIEYLKSSDQKSTRIIKPESVSKQVYKGFEFIGVYAYDQLRRDYRVFRLDRILSARRSGNT